MFLSVDLVGGVPSGETRRNEYIVEKMKVKVEREVRRMCSTRYRCKTLVRIALELCPTAPCTGNFLDDAADPPTTSRRAPCVPADRRGTPYSGDDNEHNSARH